MSKIEVNTIDSQCGSALQIGCTNTATIGLGKSGDTITIPSGATIVNSGTQTGFGRTGTVDWVTTPKVTGDSPITAVTGEGYFLNTTAGAITINLPAGAAGSIVSMADYAATWQTNNVTVAPNGSDKIGSKNSNATLSTEGQSVTFIYVDGTQGWVNTMDSTSNVRGATFIVATGGTPCAGATVGDYKVHTFTGPGTFTVCSVGSLAPNNVVDYLVVAGGGGSGAGCSGSSDGGAGGGAGGYRESPGTATGSYTVSPLGAAPAVALPVTATGYPIVVGGGGAGSTQSSGARGVDGSTSSFSTISSAGGGSGASRKISGGTSPLAPGNSGGSGGGGASQGGSDGTGGIGNTPPVNPAQGFPGLNKAAPNNNAGAGGGATAVGTIGPVASIGNTGGAGATSNINNTPTARAGGGGGGASATGGTGGTGGGGTGTPNSPNAATINTGGGGGGGYQSTSGGAGGSGVVIIRYKFQ